MMNQNKRKLKKHFLVIDGMDGAGKTTMCNLISKKYYCDVEKEPTELYWGNTIRKQLSDVLTNSYYSYCLFNLDRIEHNIRIIKKLKEGKNVVSDRYSESSFACQISTQDNEKSKILLEWMEKNSFEIPHSLIMLVCDPDICLKRLSDRGSAESPLDVIEEKDHLVKSRNEYIRQCNSRNGCLIDTTNLTINEVYEKIEEYIKTRNLFYSSSSCDNPLGSK